MEKQSYISPKQAIVVLIVTRILFSTVHFYSLHAGRSIQDILPAVPVAFGLNFLTAVPLLFLLKRNPGKDPIECASNILGRGAGIATGIFYLCFFSVNNIICQVTFRYYFSDTIIPEAKMYAIIFPLIAITVYAACKGLESIMRFGTIIFIIFMVVLAFLTATLIPSIRPSVGPRFLFPFFYNGPGIFLQEILNQFNSNIQIVGLAFCASYFRGGIRLGKIFAKWNLLTFAIMFGLFTLCIAVLGPFGARQFFPLQSIAAQSTISVFDRLDSVYSMSWMLNVVLTASFYTCMQVQCLNKMGLNSHRTLMTILVGVVNLICVYALHGYITLLHSVMLNWNMLWFNMAALILFPVMILIGDVVKKGKGAKHEVA